MLKMDIPVSQALFMLRCNCLIIATVYIQRMPMNSSFSQIKTFLTDYIKFEQKNLLKHLATEKQEIVALTENFLPLHNQWVQEQYQRASSFNIFEIMRYGHYETRLHTPFLKDLLSPDGRHGRGDLFFRKFIKRFFPLPIEKFAIQGIHVWEEYPTEDGRIDILFQFRLDNQTYQVALENKINHYDGDKQLERYYNYLIQQRSLTPESCFLVYLNRYGNAPRLKSKNGLAPSIPLQLYNQLKQERRFIQLSYKRNIVQWLEDCKEEINAARLAETLDQYIELIKRM
jgi:hypothetical protein